MQTPLSLVLQAFFISNEGSQCSKNTGGGGVLKTLRLKSQRPGTGPQNGNSRKSAGGGLAQVLAKKPVLARVLAQVLASCFVSVFPKKGPDLPALVPALRPAPPFLPALVPAPLPALFWNSHFGVL